MAILGTSALRREYGPACAPHGDLYLPAYRALDAVLKAYRYAPRRKDTGAYSCRAITGGTGYSLHSYGPGTRFTFWNGLTIPTSLAVDLNWTTNPYGRRLISDMPPAMVAAIKRIRTKSGHQLWGWGGDYRTNKDAMHYEIVCPKSALRSGVDWTTLPGRPPVLNTGELTVSDIAKILAELNELQSEQRAIKMVVVDLAKQQRDRSEAEKRRDGSVYGWLRAVAEKVGATRDRAIDFDPNN